MENLIYVPIAIVILAVMVAGEFIWGEK